MRTTNYLLLILCVTILFSCKTEVKKDMVVISEVEVVKEKSIYEKLGGEEGVSGIVEDIVAKHLENENIKHYFINLQENSDYFNQFKQHVKDFLVTGTGGPANYQGRDMQSAHNGLNLSESDFLEALDDILFVLDNHKVDRVSRNELLATLYAMKDAVIKQ